jgi:site-specific recombinase XerD
VRLMIFPGIISSLGPALTGRRLAQKVGAVGWHVDFSWRTSQSSGTGSAAVSRREPSTAPVAAAETLQLVLVMAAPQRPHHPRHALRHSFSSRLRENDADLALIQEALGHSNIATTIVYAHLSTAKRMRDLTRHLEG